eukprot:292824_1
MDEAGLLIANHQKPQILTGIIAERSDGDDPCIGNRFKRTVIISLTLIVFFSLGLPLFGKQCMDAVDMDQPEPEHIACILTFIASSIIIICTGLLIIFFISPCGDNFAKILCFLMMISGGLYSIACMVITITTSSNIKSWGFEAWIPSGLSILLGSDVLWKTLNAEIRRVKILFWFLLLGSGSLVVEYTTSSVNNVFIYEGYIMVFGFTVLCLYITTVVLPIIADADGCWPFSLLCTCNCRCMTYCVKERMFKGLSTSILRLLTSFILLGSGGTTFYGYLRYSNNITMSAKEFYGNNGTTVILYYV